MKQLILGLLLLISFSCSDHKQEKVESAISKTSDSLISKLEKVNDTLLAVKDDIVEKIPKVSITTDKNIPITLQWISFDEPGVAKLSKAKAGWFPIRGEQTNSNNEYVKIDGKIKRVDENRITFVGTIVTYVKYNNGGKPCEKMGEQLFLKKNNRTYYRLQHMENCAGGRLLDYVDLYKLDDYL